ncbi:hypothetical protein PSH85_16050 [Pseudomonas simiae]|jgi:hypothetical protein|uniref:hypothetical protein n=1 Tax=Pseudomonas TaxID=286 RepID=UPI000AF45B3E|nr:MULTISPECIES: hypothetical protein [Pseudomonas]MCF5172045.1 hypothetical protein [Pseudomonas canadensis]WLG31876.1 hypothetical protein PSH82_16020 [Pseudomonas simiae]WLI21882.1 hypothetical protein PSH85_16050 [Pseudomonas simiae]
MSPNLEEKRIFWTQAYLAAIAGLSGSSQDLEVAKRAVQVADEALKAYVSKMSHF